MRLRSTLAAGVVLCVAMTARAADPPKGYQKKITVSAPTRLDWTYTVSNQSLAEPPKGWLGDYDSKKQTYELFVPAGYDPKKPAALFLFVAAGNEPAGFKSFEPVCKDMNALFASPYGAGNNTDTKKRVRIVLDVLDDVRRNYTIDTDRTYIGGFSGGGRIANAIAFALPEYFGGVIGVCASGDVRTESYLRQRVMDRLSVALITGETDFNRGELERLRGPYLTEIGVRAKVWMVPKMGHAIPGGKPLEEAVKWLDDGLKERQALAKKYPASRLGSDEAPSREEAAKALVAEAKERLKAKGTLYSGLMQLQGAMTRWPDTKAGAEAKKLLLEYDAMKEKPWEADDIAEQRKFLIAQARALATYATGDLPATYEPQRKDMAKKALEMWELIQKDGVDAKAAEEAKTRIPALKKIVEGK